LDNLIGTFLGTRDVKLSSKAGKARQQGLPMTPSGSNCLLSSLTS
jgi:hypothetical protein